MKRLVTVLQSIWQYAWARKARTVVMDIQAGRRSLGSEDAPER